MDDFEKGGSIFTLQHTCNTLQRTGTSMVNQICIQIWADAKLQKYAVQRYAAFLHAHPHMNACKCVYEYMHVNVCMNIYTHTRISASL